MALVAFTGNVSFSEEWSATQKEVWKMQEALFGAMVNGDLKGQMALYHKDCAVLYHRSLEPMGKSTIKDMSSFLLDSAKLEPLGIRVIGDVAVTHYYYKIIWQGIDRIGRATRTWIKQNGKWQIIGGMDANCNLLPPCLWP